AMGARAPGRKRGGARAAMAGAIAWVSGWPACSGGLYGLFGTPLQHFAHKAVLARGFGTLEVVALGVVGDGLDRLSGVARQDGVQVLLHREDFARMDLDVGRLALEAAQGLVDHHPRVRQRIALARRA